MSLFSTSRVLTQVVQLARLAQLALCLALKLNPRCEVVALTNSIMTKLYLLSWTQVKGWYFTCSSSNGNERMNEQLKFLAHSSRSSMSVMLIMQKALRGFSSSERKTCLVGNWSWSQRFSFWLSLSATCVATARHQVRSEILRNEEQPRCVVAPGNSKR